MSVKKYRAIHAFHVDDIAAKFQAKARENYGPFYSPEDRASPTFRVCVGFGDIKRDVFTASLWTRNENVQITTLNINFYSSKLELLKSRHGSFEEATTLVPDKDIGWKYKRTEHLFKSNESQGFSVVVAVEYQVSDPTEEVPKCPINERFYGESLSMLDDESSADVTFLVSGVEIKAHRVIIMARSAYFKIMFASGMKEAEENVVKVSDVELIIFKELLKFLYGGVPPSFSHDVTPDLLIVAEKYGVDDLKQSCEAQLSANLNAGNVVEYLLLADGQNCSSLLHLAKIAFRSYLGSLEGVEHLGKLKTNPPLLLELLCMYGRF